MYTIISQSMKPQKPLRLPANALIITSYIRQSNGGDAVIYCRVHCVKSVRIRSYSGQYSVRMRENTDQNNSEYGYIPCSGYYNNKVIVLLINFSESLASSLCFGSRVDLIF